MMNMRLTTLLLLLLLTTASFGFQSSYDEVDNHLKQVLDTLYDENDDFAGATLGVVLPDGKVLSYGIGYQNIEEKTPMDPASRMLGGSTGKIFVSASLMQLVERGRLQLDDRVSQYLGKYEWYSRIQNTETLTLRNLMQHASGISRYVFGDTFQEDVHKDPDRIWKPEELLAYVFDMDPLFEAGTDFAYSDTNYILLAMVLEEVTGTTMYQYVQDNFLSPHEFELTTPQVRRKIEGLAVGYNRPDDDFYPGVVVKDGDYKYNLQFEWAGGGFVTNSSELARAGKLIYENQLFSADLMGDFLNGIDAKRLGGTWGLGVHIQDTPQGQSWGHSGFFPGYITNMRYYPDHRFCVAYQVNTSDPRHLSLYRKMSAIASEIVKVLERP